MFSKTVFFMKEKVQGYCLRLVMTKICFLCYRKKRPNAKSFSDSGTPFQRSKVEVTIFASLYVRVRIILLIFLS